MSAKDHKTTQDSLDSWPTTPLFSMMVVVWSVMVCSCFQDISSYSCVCDCPYATSLSAIIEECSNTIIHCLELIISDWLRIYVLVI